MTTSLASQRLADENVQDRVRPFAFNPSIDDAAAAALRTAGTAGVGLLQLALRVIGR
jgi:hypothetical protein